MIKVLVVDDSIAEISLIEALLHDMSIVEAHDGMEALDMLGKERDFDIILLDLFMPNLDGFGVLERLRDRGVEIPVIILTNAEDVEYEVRGLDLGAVDYIRKPINRRSLYKRIEIQLSLRESRRMLDAHNAHLQEQVDIRTAQVVRTGEMTVQALVALLEVRNIETSNHVKRTSRMMDLLCRRMAERAIAGYGLTENMIQGLVRTAPLHDIGKVGIPDSILLKPGKLSPEEFEIMKKHVDYGYHALEFQDAQSSYVMGFIETARQIILSHHERFDGSGYPNALVGTDIPLAGRLMAIIDVYDALTSDRVYKKAIPHQEALKIIEKERSKHFDPVITDVFLSNGDEIALISGGF